MRVVVYQEKQISREREYHINLSTLMNLQDMYILSKQIHMHKLQLKKKKKKKKEEKKKQNKKQKKQRRIKQKQGIQKRFYGKTIGEYI